jgi:hypothetical protein
MVINAKVVQALAAKGLSHQQICDAIGINVATLTRRRKESAELDDAIKAGQARGIAVITNALYQQAIKGNTSAAIFYLKNRAGWRDRVEVENEFVLPAPLIISVPIETEPRDITPSAFDNGNSVTSKNFPKQLNVKV